MTDTANRWYYFNPSSLGGQLGWLGAILVISLGVRLALFHLPGYEIDTSTFTAWYQVAAERGLYGFYDSPNWSDYPPFNVYIFWLFGKIAQVTGGVTPLLLKLPQNIFDLATVVLIFCFLRREVSPRWALLGAAVYAFNPATIFNLAVWGQMDSVYTFFMVGTLYALLRSRWEFSGFLFAMGVQTKPQTAILLPVVACVMLKKGGWLRSITSAGVFWVTVFAFILPFHWENPLIFLGERYSGYWVYPYTSLNAYNLWAIGGFWLPDTVTVAGLSLQMWGLVAFVILAAYITWQFCRTYGSRSAIYAVFLLLFAFFMVMTRIHERYLFPVLAVLVMILPIRYVWGLYAGVTVTYFINLVCVLDVLNAGTGIPTGHWTFFVLIPVNIALCAFALLIFHRLPTDEPPGTNDIAGAVRLSP